MPMIGKPLPDKNSNETKQLFPVLISVCCKKKTRRKLLFVVEQNIPVPKINENFCHTDCKTKME